VALTSSGTDRSEARRHPAGASPATAPTARGDERAREQTGADRGERDNADLEQIGEEDRAAGRAEQLEGGDARALGVEIGRDSVADADAGDDQGGEPDESQELAEPLDEAPCARSAVGPVLDLPARSAELFLQPLPTAFGSAPVGSLSR
jgi:hypothetical protein